MILFKNNVVLYAGSYWLAVCMYTFYSTVIYRTAQRKNALYEIENQRIKNGFSKVILLSIESYHFAMQNNNFRNTSSKPIIFSY